MAERARAASRALAKADRGPKDNALAAIAAALDEAAADERSLVRIANARDLEAASELGPSLVDRLRLDEPRLRQLARAVRDIAAQEDPVGRVTSMERRPNGLRVGQVQVPLGVVCMIFEARPNVTVDAAALCLKSGNACLLRGGKEARESNAALGALVREAIAKAGLPEDSVQVLTDVSRDETKELVALEGLIDLVIPRGGEGLVRFVKEHARVPVIEHYKGVCHLFIDEDADVPTALALVENGKLSRPGVCNATECVLVHELVAGAFLPRLGALAVERGLEVRGCPSTVALVPSAIPAQADDFGAEFLAPILACRVVKSFDEALLHVARYGSLHTEAICTRSYERAERFLREVDASCVLVNASTRFNDGGELGLGAEIGISTTKLHAYGPMGLDSLTTRKWIAYGLGQVR
jgi:glutamate-5-semialdehyde dehydrogenase